MPIYSCITTIQATIWTKGRIRVVLDERRASSISALHRPRRRPVYCAAKWPCRFRKTTAWPVFLGTGTAIDMPSAMPKQSRPSVCLWGQSRVRVVLDERRGLLDDQHVCGAHRVGGGRRHARHDALVPADVSRSARYRHRRRHVYCAGMAVPVLKMTASERRSF